MPKSSAARVTGCPAVRTAWAKAVRSSDTVLVLHGMTDPPKEESIMPEKRHPCPYTTRYPCTCASQLVHFLPRHADSPFGRPGLPPAPGAKQARRPLGEDGPDRPAAGVPPPVARRPR